MTETVPVFTKKQLKSSLSGKKTKTKTTIRNVLASPYRKYWPLISFDHVKSLHSVLSKHLPRIIPKKKQIPWEQIKDVPRSERKSFRKEQKQCGNSKEISVEERKGVIFGINDTTKAIENGIAKSVLIVEDVQPKLMVDHIIDQCVLLRIPVLVVPELRTLLKDTCGISSVAIGFRDLAKYEKVQEVIEAIYKEYPVPRDHINFHRSLDLVNSSVILIEDNTMGESIIEVVDSTAHETLDQTINASMEDSVVESQPNSVYLYRKTKDKRVFIPGKNSDKLKNNNEMQVDSPGIFSAHLTASVTPKLYKSLKVKKVKGDANRNKRKIIEVKKKTQQKMNKKIKKNS